MGAIGKLQAEGMLTRRQLKRCRSLPFAIVQMLGIVDDHLACLNKISIHQNVEVAGTFLNLSCWFNGKAGGCHLYHKFFRYGCSIHWRDKAYRRCCIALGRFSSIGTDGDSNGILIGRPLQGNVGAVGKLQAQDMDARLQI